MQSPSGDKDRLPGVDFNPVEAALDFTADGRLPQPIPGQGPVQAQRHLRAGLGGGDVPHLRLARTILVCPSIVVLRVDLERTGDPK